jgi:hypothetical protein
MADIQRYFEDFHNTIRLATYDENEQLRDKRDMLVKELRANLRGVAPPFTEFDQGSYALRTGVVPKDGNYDIDEGLIFDCFSDQHPDPMVLKAAVRKAIERSGRTVRIRRACVTVEYMRDGKADYHVDLAIYAKRRDGVGLDLAIGRPDTTTVKRSWQQNDPQGLIKLMREHHSDDKAAQMRRVIRYLKRWRDHRFEPDKGPVSVLLTIAAYHWFAPQFEMFSDKSQDAKALRGLIEQMLGKFISPALDVNGQAYLGLQVRSPVVRFEDLLAGYSREAMVLLHARLQELRDALSGAEREPLPEKACRLLEAQFGEEFPTPSPDETARRQRKPYITTGQSA